MNCYPREEFVEKRYLDSLTCTIGLGIFNNPVSLPCQHVFCRRCIEAWHDKTGTCPKCREKFTKASIRPQWNFEKMIASAQAQCEYCDWKGLHSSLQTHLICDCPESAIFCPHCGESLKRKDFMEHSKLCKEKLIECEHCQVKVTVKTLPLHLKSCVMNKIYCPNGCGMKLIQEEMELHIKEECSKGKRICKFTKTSGCKYMGNEAELAEHYKTSVKTHLQDLAKTVIALQAKIDSYNPSRIMEFPISTPSIITPKDSFKSLAMKWSNGSTRMPGSTVRGWSFFLSATTITGPFRAKVKVATLNSEDANTWKICLGVFNSPYFTPGSWGKFKNGWGYISGNGEKIYTSAQAYGKKYGLNDIITIEYSMDRKLVFFLNEISQGVAFSNVEGSQFYLAVGLSDIGHSVEILEVLALA